MFQARLLIILSLVLSGCSTTANKFQCHVNALAPVESAPHHSFVISSFDKALLRDTLQFKEFSGHVEKALHARGFITADTPKNADIWLFLSYGVNAPETHFYTRNVPVYGHTGMISSTTQTASPRNPREHRSTTVYTPQQGIIGYKKETEQYVTYDAYIILEAYAPPNNSEEEIGDQLWKTTVISAGSSNDLRYVFPYLLTAMTPYMAKNTSHTIQVNIYDNDARALQYSQPKH